MSSNSEQFYSETAFLHDIAAEVSTVLVGQDELLRCLLIGLLCGGHLLLEGLPGLAKTLAVKTLAGCLGGSFSRLQFTPDLLPSDITGSMVYRPEEQKFSVRLGPIAANLVLADEINRAPAKTQSALLEAMQEQQVSIDGQAIAMPQPYLVVATQNPIEQAGTYALPEAQKDRFLMCVRLAYPKREEEELVLQRMACSEPMLTVKKVAEAEQVLRARRCLDQVHVADELRQYVLDLVIATRPGQASQLSSGQGDIAALRHIELGASPRAGIALLLAAKANALLETRDYVLPEDVQKVALPVLAHRIILSFEAEAEGIEVAQVLSELLRGLKAP
ncbi:MAG: AAA family ATPase [Lentisphaeria bacterium]|nr:AAA family ATPase [Lentisphaeria bacterium]NLZ60925.1 AAA domain-containing protein [Lentisphaerota bacterium]